jgi:PEGA domain
MTRPFPLRRNRLLAILTSAGLLLAFSPLAHAQHSRGGGSSSGGSSGGGHATSSGSGSGDGQSRSTPAPAPVSSGSSSDGRSGQTSGHAVPRGSAGSTGTNRSGGGATGAVTRDGSSDNSGGSSTDSSGNRPREGRTTVGHAVARPPYAAGGGTTIIVAGGGYGGYYPWGYGGLGFGSYYGYYDPWDDPYQPVYAGGGYGYDGALRLKVKPRDAAVYVDGYFAGRVDDFDGVFQRLKIESGPHHVELRLDGYEPLTVDVRIDPDRTVTYTGELKKLP